MERELFESRKDLRKINDLEFQTKHGIFIGDIVDYQDGKKVKRGVISHLDGYDTEPYAYYFTQFNKDGSPSLRNTRVYHPEKLTLVSKATPILEL